MTLSHQKSISITISPSKPTVFLIKTDHFPIKNRHLSYQNRLKNRLFSQVVAVPQDEAWVIERLGKCDRVLGPGLGFVMPGGEKVAHRCVFDGKSTVLS
jgi:hypothetical protein